MIQAYIIDAIRTPVGKRNGGLKHVRPDDLLAHCLSALIKRNPTLDPNAIDDVIIGCAMPEGPQGLNVARIATLLAHLPERTPAYTINRFCCSGVQAVANAAMMIRSNQADIVIAGGVESMSQVPMMGNKPALNPKIFNDENVGIAYGMGLTAEKVAQQYHVTKDAQNQFAFDSHQKALKAQEQGLFDQEIIAIESTVQQFDNDSVTPQTTHISADEGPRADTTLDKLNALKPVFASAGSVTAGNSSQMSDGSACVLVVSEKIVKQLQLDPIARFVQYSVVGVDPKIMGIGPIEAIPHALKGAQISQEDLGWIELNEAFAAQSLAVMNTLGLNPQVVNPLGGAIALGHPLGATGAIRTATLMSAFKRDAIKYGMITMCIGTGMGAAGIFENLKTP